MKIATLVVLLCSIPAEQPVTPTVLPAVIKIAVDSCDIGVAEGNPTQEKLSPEFLFRLRACFLKIILASTEPEVVWLRGEMLRGRIGLLVQEGLFERLQIKNDYSDINGERFILLVDADWVIQTVQPEPRAIRCEVRTFTAGFMQDLGYTILRPPEGR